jgi:hypothetical protein
VALNVPILSKRRISRSGIARAAICAALILGFLFISFPGTTLSIKEGITGRELDVIPVESGSPLEVEYIHSMYGVPQREIFSIGRGLLFRLEQVTFGSLSAALYYDSDPPSGPVFQENVWIIKADGKQYPSLRYRVGTSTGHTLKIRGKRVDLLGFVSATNGLICLDLERRSWWSSLFVSLKRRVLHLFGRLDEEDRCGSDSDI